jgi:hypothetical protein
MGAKQLAAIEHIIVLMLGNRSFDHMLSFRYEDLGNNSRAGHELAQSGICGEPMSRLVRMPAVRRKHAQ